MPHNSQVTSYTTPLNDAVGTFSSFTRAPSKLRRGFFLGFGMEGVRDPRYLDFDDLKNEGHINAKTVGIWGDLMGGKSSVAKIIAAEGGSVNRGLRKQRVYADDHRRFAGVQEYSRLARFYDSEVITITHRINVFDESLGMTHDEHVETAGNIFKSAADGMKASPYMVLAMQAAIFIMFHPDQRELQPSIESYAEILNRISGSDGSMYMARVGRPEEDFRVLEKGEDGQYMEVERPTMLAVRREDVEKFNSRVRNINWDEFRHAAGIVAANAVRFLDGEYGKTFGGRESIAALMSRRFTGFDYSGKNERTVAFLVGFIWRVKLSAKQRRDRRFMYDFELHDENVSLWKYLEYGDPMARALKHARGEDNIMMLTSHRPMDYETVGDVGSRARSLATNMIHDLGCHIFTRFKNRTMAREIQRYFDLSNVEREWLIDLRPGQVAFKFASGPLELVEIARNPLRKWLVESEMANAQSMQRRSNDDDIDEVEVDEADEYEFSNEFGDEFETV